MADALQRRKIRREGALRAEYGAKLAEQGAEQTQLVVGRIVRRLLGEAAATAALPANDAPRAPSPGTPAAPQGSTPRAVEPLGSEEKTRAV